MPETISQVAKTCQVAKKSVWELFEQGACTAVSCSYRIFNAKTSLLWDLRIRSPEIICFYFVA